MSQKKRRITMKLKTPNPLFEKWITEWRNKAREENSKMEFCFNKALESLRKYPLPMESGKDCKILKGFGDKICQMLDNKLKEYKKNHCTSPDKTTVDRMHFCSENNEENEPVRKKKQSQKQTVPVIPVASPTKQKDSSKEYIPKEDSGPYAILVTLYKKSLEPSYPGYLTKSELIEEGQCLTNKSFTKPDPGSRYTAWSSMRTLISKSLVEKKSNPPKFSLTDQGLLLARKLYDKGKNTDLCSEFSPTNFFDNLQKENNTSSNSLAVNLEKEVVCIDLLDEHTIEQKPSSSTVSSFSTYSSVTSVESSTETNIGVSLQRNCKTFQKHTSSSSVASSTQSSSQEECVIFPPDTFDIILYIDTCETAGSSVDIVDDPILAELKHLAVVYEVKNLKVGDYTWICRDRVTKKEMVLPYIIERKRMDDFGSSIKDGRYHEQKFRLKKSGIQNITYLIEKYGNNQHVGLPVTTLYQAATNTAIQDGFSVKFTKNCRDTAKYLANFSSLLIRMFKSKTLASCPKENLTEVSLNDDLVSLMTFKEFNKSSSKNKPLRVSDLFVKMLVQIKGMSVDRALAIVQEYPTPAILQKAYTENPGVKGEKLLAQIHFGDCKKTIGQVLSKTVYQLFTMQSF